MIAILVSLIAIGAAPAEASEGRTFFVAARGGDGGTGTREAPFRSLGEAVGRAEAGDRIWLLPGEHAGGYTLGPGVALSGEPGAVVTGPAQSPALVLSEGVAIHHLVVRGGPVGILVNGDVALQDVRVSEARESGVEVAKGTLRADSLVVHGGAKRARETAVGIALAPGTRAELRRCSLRGPLRRGVQLGAGAEARLIHSQLVGVEVGLHAMGASLGLDHVSLEGGTGPALFISGGRASLEHVRVQGHEYGLLARSGATVRASDFVSVRAARAGIAVVESELRAEDLHVLDSGNLAAIQNVGGKLFLEHFEVVRAVAFGLALVGGSAILKDGKILGVKSDPTQATGEGLHLSRTRVEAQGLKVQGAEGSCVMVMERSRLLLKDAVLEGCGGPVFDLSAASEVDARSIQLRGGSGPAAAVSEASELTLDNWSWRGGGSRSLAADCSQEVRVWAGRLEAPGAIAFDMPCVRPLAEKP